MIFIRESTYLMFVAQSLFLSGFCHPYADSNFRFFLVLALVTGCFWTQFKCLFAFKAPHGLKHKYMKHICMDINLLRNRP